MIYEVEGGYVISASNVWRPGCFESKRACNMAKVLSDGQIQSLQDDANKNAGGCGGVITESQIRSVKQKIAVKALTEV